MPFSALALVHLLNLPQALGIGLIIVGCCPGGVSSNIMSYLCHGDVAYSVGMSTVSNALAPLMTPLLVTWMASGMSIDIAPFPMFLSITETVILPVALGSAPSTSASGIPTRSRAWHRACPASRCSALPPSWAA